MKTYIVHFYIGDELKKSNPIKAIDEDDAASKFDDYFGCVEGWSPTIFSVIEH